MVAGIFTNEQAVIDAVEEVIPIVCMGMLGDGLNAVYGGVVRGCGRQSMGATLNLIGW